MHVESGEEEFDAPGESPQQQEEPGGKEEGNTFEAAERAAAREPEPDGRQEPARNRGTGARARICVGSDPFSTTHAGSYAPCSFQPEGQELWKNT